MNRKASKVLVKVRASKIDKKWFKSLNHLEKGAFMREFNSYKKLNYPSIDQLLNNGED